MHRTYHNNHISHNELGKDNNHRSHKHHRNSMFLSAIAATCLLAAAPAMAFNFAPVGTDFKGPELNQESDKSLNLDSVGTEMEAPDLNQESDKSLDLNSVGTEMNAPDLNQESDKSLNLDSVSTEMEAPQLHKAWDGMLDLAPVSTEYDMPDLINMTEYHLNGPVSTQFSLELQKAFGGIHLDPIHTTLNLDLGEIGIAADTLFDVDKSELRPEGKEVLNEFFADFVATLTQEDRIDKLAYIDFAGHTDSDGSFEYNLQLSLDRAYAVYDYCLSNCVEGLSQEQIAKLVEVSHVNGYSYTQPVLDAAGNEDKAASRRVTIRYYYSAESIDQGNEQ